MCETAVKTEDLREKASRKLWEIVDNPNTTPTVRIRAIDTLGKMNGWHSNTLTLETPKRQNELDSAYQEEVERFALLRHNMLPAQNVTVSDVTPSAKDNNTNHPDHDLTNKLIKQEESSQFRQDESLLPPRVL